MKKKKDHSTHVIVLAVHIVVALLILLTYMDIKQEVKQIRQHDLPELRSQILKGV